MVQFRRRTGWPWRIISRYFSARSNTPAWCASLLCGDFELARATGLRAQKRYQLFNGPIECSLIVCDPIAPPVREGEGKRELGEGAQMVANRLRKNLKALRPWREREGVDCFRAYDADIPEYACAVDVYTTTSDDTWLHVQEYAAPADIPEATTRKRLNELGFVKKSKPDALIGVMGCMAERLKSNLLE